MIPISEYMIYKYVYIPSATSNNEIDYICMCCWKPSEPTPTHAHTLLKPEEPRCQPGATLAKQLEQTLHLGNKDSNTTLTVHAAKLY